MRKPLRTVVVMVSALSLLAIGTNPSAADSITSCATAQLKAYRALVKVLVGEATRACAAGFSGNATPVDSARLAAATDKFNTAAQQAITTFGQPNCLFGQAPNALPSPAGVISSAQSIADDLCAPPTPTPVPARSQRRLASLAERGEQRRRVCLDGDRGQDLVEHELDEVGDEHQDP